MSLAASLLILSLAFSITGSPLGVRKFSITLPLTRRLNSSNGTINFLQHDKDRVAALGGYNTHGRRVDSIPMTSRVLLFTVAVDVGIPSTTYNLVVDTGSSITWVGGSTPYVKSDTGVKTSWPVEENYSSEDDTVVTFKGTIYRDTVTLGGLTVTDFQLGVGSTGSGLYLGEDGILGLGPVALSHNTMPFAMDDTIPTFTDCLYRLGEIDQRVVGIFLDPDARSGELTFGEPDNTKYRGDIIYTPVTDIPFASWYWGINGSNFISIATNAYEMYRTVTGAVVDPRTGLLKITPNQYGALQPLEFHIEGRIFSLTRDAQIWPRSLNHKLKGLTDPYATYLIVTDMGGHFGSGIDFRIGYPFMQRFYTVLDGSHRRVGFAPTQFTDATTN
ncbi:hypothetical protein BDR07DRAFT_1479329 [Suillus spraguei]|nr:hypothetical protein BDR07DRAFT_1479329 [Suillus spraguei]